jgi:carboxymethylenebutenolidase
VVQEIFGVNGHIRDVADGFAQDGYVALAPALYDRVEKNIELGYTPDDIQKGLDVRSRIDLDDTLKDLAAAVDALQTDGPVGIVGYCWGGSLAYIGACRLDGLKAAVGYYGAMIHAHRNETPRAPTMLHFGSKDASIPMDQVEEIRKAQPMLTFHIYDADHGFNCDQRGQYDAESAKVARERTLDFFEANLT